jgi:hypothetical protein
VLARPVRAGRQTGGHRTPPAVWHRWWPAAWGGLVGTLLFLLARRSLSDDSMISLSFARNVASTGCWCLTSGIPSNTATSPLNVWLLAAGTWLLDGRALVAAGAVLVVCLAASAWLLHRLGGWLPAVVGSLLLASSPVLNSAVGLETFLAAAALLAVTVAAAEQRTVWAAAACGASALTRPDLAVAAVAIVTVLAVGYRWRRAVLALSGGALVALPWPVATWWLFGSAVPATLPVKAGQRGWGPDGSVHLAESLPLYAHGWPAATWLTVSTLVVGVLAATVAVDRRWWDVVALAVGGALDLAVMASTAQSPVAYYAGPAVAGLGLCGLIVAARARWPIPAVAVVVAACVVFTVVRWESWSEGFAPLRQNWATDSEYQHIAAELPADGPILSNGEIGALAFYCASRCTVVDPFLSDPGRTDTYVVAWRAQHPALESNWRRYQAPPPVAVRYQLDYTRRPAAGALRVWRVTGSDRQVHYEVLTAVTGPAAVR